MKDPIGIYENLKEQYFKYIDTAFSVDDSEFKLKRKEEYLPEGKDANNVLAQEPYLELIKAYPSSGKKISDLELNDIPKDSEGNNYFSSQEELELFQKFCSAGLVGDFPLYQHQIDMIKNYALGMNCIITTGTGSGKTEAFLLPLFAYLTKQIIQWKEKKPEPALEYNWFKNPTRHNPNGTAHYQAQEQRKNSTRKSSIKAIILYPMNALVDDQMTRLRKALDSKKSESFYADYCNNHRVYFGQYNGATPISSEISTQAKNNELREKLIEIQNYWNEIQNVIKNGTLSKRQIDDIIYTSQKIGGSELLTRFDMQKTPPDIFITNYSMLNIMLMRDREDSIFTKTKQWLEEDPENNVFHLIVDELHLNRGSSGTELALLLRLVEYRLGLHPGHPQLRVLASSASLDPEDPESKKYIEDFFGMDFKTHFKIVKEQPDYDSLTEPIINQELLENFQNLSEQENQDKSDEEIAKEIFGNDFLIKNTNQLKQTLLKGFENDESKHTFSLSVVNTKLFGEESDYSALKGLLKLRAIYDDEKFDEYKRDLPRIRFHLFFKNVDDLHTVAGEKDKIVLNSSKTKLDGKKVFQNLYCDECGTLFYGGRRFDNGNRLEMLPISSEFEKMPDLNLDKRPEYLQYGEYIVFWPNVLLGKELNPQSETFDEVNGLNGIWEKALLNIHKGTISSSPSDESNSDYLIGYIYRVNSDESKSLPCQCPQCAQTYKDKKFMKSPVRTFRTGYSQVTQVLASSLLKQLSPEDVDNRKLLIFSDSRSAAADLANKLERNNYSDVLRKNVFRIGNININQIKNKISDYFDTTSQEDWNWEKIIENEELGSFLNIKVDSSFLQILKSLGGESFKMFLTPIIDGLDSSNDKIVPIKSLLPSRTNPGELFREFLTRGINPVGNDYKFQKNWGGKGSANWYDIYDLENGHFTDAIEDTSIGGSSFHEDLQNEFTEQICNVLFGRHQFAIETMAKGYVSFPSDQFDLIVTKMQEAGSTVNATDRELLNQIVNSIIRIFGYKYRHWGTSYAPKNNNANITTYAKLIANNSAYKRYLDNVFIVNENLQHIEKKVLVRSFLDVLGDFNPHKNFKKVQYNKTGIRTVKQTAPFTPYINPYYFDLFLLKEEDLVYKCSNCGANHGHFSAGVCAHCFKPLDLNNHIVAKEVWEENFYANSEEPIRMHTEELTGQTDSSDAKNRQKAFKNIFLELEANSSNKKAEQIDVLSVTTTMEVGVDIGSLEATMMANMPPERYNYQQRVGRAGRGGQAYSVAVTLCRGNSHDSYYYSNLDGMVNAKPPTPFIPMESDSDISKRIFYKEIFRDVFKQNGKGNIRLELSNGERFQDNHGEFGSQENFKNGLSITKEKFISDINIVLNHEKIILLSSHLNISNDFYNEKISGEIIYDEVLLKLSELDIKPEGLAECLAEAGLLPMYGMPTRTRSLYHNFDFKKWDFSIMSRDLEMAISEYAPGNEITKDKKIFRIEAITSPITKRNDLTQYNIRPIEKNLFYYDINKDGSIDMEKDTLIEQFSNEDWESIKNSERKIGVIPKAYITKMSPEDNTSAVKPYFSVSIPRILNGGNTGFIKNDGFNNLDSFFHQGHIISFNEGENGLGFNFDTPTNILEKPELLKNTHIPKREYDNMEDTSSVLKYSLASNKYTSLLQVKPTSGHPGVQLNCEQMNDEQAGYVLNNFHLQGLKAGVFSAAFLLRSVFTQQQDIDNSELEVLGLRHYLNDDGSNVTGFSYADKLSNGSGFSQKLSEKLTEYINLCLDPTGDFNGEILQFVVDLLSRENQKNCDVADYTNLLNYRNKRFHPLLNWRLGVSYLRLLRGKEDEIEKVINADSNLPEFGCFYGRDTWLKGVGVQLQEFKDEYGINSDVILDFNLPFLQGHSNSDFENKVIIPYHPLWNKDSLETNPLIKKIIDELSDEDKIFIDSFNLTNRPGDCYEKLIIGGGDTSPNWDVLN